MSASVATSAGANTLHHHQQKQQLRRQVFNWLDDLSLSHLFEKFLENGYEDLELCTKIGETDLNAIGIPDLRERIAVLQAVRQLQHELHSLPPPRPVVTQFPAGVNKSVAQASQSSSASSFLKALSPTRRKIPEGALPSRPSSRLGTWTHEEVELQEIRRYHHHFSSSPHQQQSFLHQQQNPFNELMLHRRNNGDGAPNNGFEHQPSNMLLLGRRSGPSSFHHQFLSADDIHGDMHDTAGEDLDDDNGDYSECTEFDLILSAQRAANNHKNNIHLSQRLSGGAAAVAGVSSVEQCVPPVFMEQCTCDCAGVFQEGQEVHNLCRFHAAAVGENGDEPFYESVSPQPPTSQQQTPHHHHRLRHQSGSKKKPHVNYPVPPLPLNYGGANSKLENNVGVILGEESSSGLSSGGGASGASASASGAGGSNNGTQSQPNFIILRSQLRDHIVQDGINFSRVSEVSLS